MINPAAFREVPLWPSLCLWWLKYQAAFWRSRIGRGLVQASCWYAGHQPWLNREPDRLSIICHACGWESPGIDLYSARVRMAWMFDKRRRKVLRFPTTKVS